MFKNLNKFEIIVKFLFLNLVLILLTTGYLYPQIKDKSKLNVNKENQYVYVDPLVFYNLDSTNGRLDLYVEVPLGNLQFKKNSSTKKYDASIDYTVLIQDSKGETVLNETISKVFSTTQEEQKSIHEMSEYIVKQYYLPPGYYELTFQLYDRNNFKEYTVKKNFNVEYIQSKNIGLSDIMIISQYGENDGKKIITPLVNNNIGNLKDFHLFFEIYNTKDNPIPAELVYTVVNKKDEPVTGGTFSYVLQPGVTKKIEKLSSKEYTLGDYKLEIKNKSSDETLAEKDFCYEWSNLPTNLKDLDLAISQMIYIASSDEIDKIKSAKTNEEKKRRFIKFWKDNDPSPNTPKNELMNEYYARVKIANQRYSHYFDGWRTDMGMVFIIYGNPTNIERHPFDMDQKPYEIWQYYDLNREFTFIDETGFGDYRLTTPIWDEEMTRIKY